MKRPFISIKTSSLVRDFTIGACTAIIVGAFGALILFSNMMAYVITDQDVYWKYLRNDLTFSSYKLEMAEVGTFQVFQYGAGKYAKDCCSVYYKGLLIEGADPESFVVLDGITNLARDKHFEFKGKDIIRQIAALEP